MGRRHTVKKWYHLKLSILIWVWFLAEKVAVFALNSDKSALLELKNSILDPYNVLSSWNSSDSTSNFDHCSWYGVSCDSNHFVTALNITGGGSSCSRISGFPLFGFGIKRPCSNEKSSVQGKLSPAIAKLGELRILVLPFNELNGEIPNEIWGREKLEVLDLEGNSISGSLPVHFSGMKNLKVLNLGFNKISGNIPNSVFVSTSLRILNLAGNQLNGTIPRFGFWFRNLKGLYLSFNQLTGSLPREIGLNCEELEYLELSGNYLTGEIPRSLGNCTRLRSVLLYSNLLVGVIPSEFGFHSHLEVLDLSRNSLSGAIPPEIGNCSMLSVLVLSNTWDPLPTQKPGLSNDEYNFYTGTIPLEITRMSSLRMLWVPRASLDGKLPNWVNCDNLEIVNLAYNFYTGGISDAFSSCKILHYLDLSSNKLTGRIPQNLPVPCMNLFDVSSNSLSGPIPRFSQNICSNVLPVFDDDAGNLPSSYLFHFAQRSQIGKSPIDLYNDDGRRVVVHDFSSNHFTGPLRPLPIVVSKQRKTVYVLSVANNNLSGPFPRVLFERCGEFSSLIVNISKNVFTGQIPANIGVSCSSLKLLDGSWNRIFGTIPSSIGNLVSIISLNLSRNFLEASLPSSIGKLKGLKFLSLSGNKLTGSIPDTISRLNSLQVLDMSSNLLTGEIPKGLVDLRNLTVLRLDSNKLSGQIPSGLLRLFTFNVSYNNLSGPLPSNGMKCSNVLGNPYLASCRMFSLRSTSENQQGFIDDPQSRDPTPPGGNLVQKVGNGGGLNSIEIASISSAAAIFSVLVALVALFIYTRKCGSRPRVSGGGSVRKEVTVFTDIGVPLNFENIVNATANFNASNCIGNGGFGATYKAEIAPGVIVAIKRLAVGRFQGFQQFDAEIKTLGRLRHKNLVTLVGYHTSEYEMFLIYNYLPGGNLEKFIQERSTRAVYWRVLHKIALDVARALAYLHDQCVPRVLHRDVKPSNILLDDDLNAYLSDFGLARLLGTSETHATTGVAGTFGYVAPEYAMTCRVSDKADVYSYGVVLLELISDKKALDPSFSPYGNGFNIVTWASMLLRQGRAKEFFTAGLWETGPHDDLVDVLHLAILCTVDSLSTRPTMKLVVRRLTQMQPPSC